jgi:hypothetical protein
VSELNRIHIHAQCVNWSAGISYPHCRACPLIGSFLLGFTYCDGRQSESDKNIIFRCSFIGSFLPGFQIVTTGNEFLCLTMIQKRNNIKHSAIWLILGRYAPSYKSDSLVFRCSFYYLTHWTGKSRRYVQLYRLGTDQYFWSIRIKLHSYFCTRFVTDDGEVIPLCRRFSIPDDTKNVWNYMYNLIQYKHWKMGLECCIDHVLVNCDTVLKILWGACRETFLKINLKNNIFTSAWSSSYKSILIDL